MIDQNQNSAVMEVAASMSTSTKTTYAGAASGFLASLASLDALAWLGILIALSGFFVNLHYKRLENRRAQELHELKKKKIISGERDVKD